jgi:hypothetical protein
MLIPQVVSISFGTLTLLLVPRMLEPSEYAQIVFWNVILSFVMLSDLGLSNVYSRKLPALLQTSKYKEAEALQSTTAIFAIAGSCIFAIGASALFYNKFESILVASLIFCASISMTGASLATSFLISNKKYQKFCFLAVVSSCLRLFVIPAVYFYGVSAWFVVTVIISACISIYFFQTFHIRIKGFSIRAVKDHIIEGCVLLLIALLWNQLLVIPRFSASMLYPNEMLAQYGLLTSVFSVVSGMAIAYFIPISRKIYAMYGDSSLDTFDYVLDELYRAQPLSVVVFIACFLSAPLLTLLFPEYEINPFFFRVMCLSILFFPLFFGIGAIYISAKKSGLYLFLLLISFFCTGFMFLLNNTGNILPAIALPLGVFIFSTLRLFFLYKVIYMNNERKRKIYTYWLQNSLWLFLAVVFLLLNNFFKIM